MKSTCADRRRMLLGADRQRRALLQLEALERGGQIVVVAVQEQEVFRLEPPTYLAATPRIYRTSLPQTWPSLSGYSIGGVSST